MLPKWLFGLHEHWKLSDRCPVKTSTFTKTKANISPAMKHQFYCLDYIQPQAPTQTETRAPTHACINIYTHRNDVGEDMLCLAVCKRKQSSASTEQAASVTMATAQGNRRRVVHLSEVMLTSTSPKPNAFYLNEIKEMSAPLEELVFFSQ